MAEVAVARSLPLGAARVLLADLVELGLIHQHPPTQLIHDRPSFELMYRVLDGLHRL